MSEALKFAELVTNALLDHGKATADLLKRLGQDDELDLPAETAKCLGDLARTGARFFLFWDNIATLLAEDGGPPLTFPKPEPCAPGEKQVFRLEVAGISTAAPNGGLRRRGEAGDTMPAGALTARVDRGLLIVEVECGGAQRGLYEGILTVADAAGNQTDRPFNVYVDPGA